MKYKSFHPGQPWLDTNGKRIHAHGGSIFYENGRYYWYGENKEKRLALTRSGTGESAAMSQAIFTTGTILA